MEHIMEQSKGFNFDKAFGTDKDLEEQGAWDEIYMDGESLNVKVARKNNAHYKKMLRSEMTKNKRKLEREDQGAIDLFDRIMIRVMAKTILLGWGELIVNGDQLEYSVENAELVLRNEDFRKEVDGISDSFDLYKQEQDEEIKGN
jgi:hypothetical protein